MIGMLRSYELTVTSRNGKYNFQVDNFETVPDHRSLELKFSCASSELVKTTGIRR